MSSMVCRPLKRAKSTVGVPLISETVSPLASMALTLVNCTAKEVTEDMGASVPMTKDAPVGPVAVLAVEPEPQPAAKSEAIARERRQTGSLPRSFVDDMGHIAFCLLRSLFGTSAELATVPLSQEGMRLAWARSRTESSPESRVLDGRKISSSCHARRITQTQGQRDSCAGGNK